MKRSGAIPIAAFIGLAVMTIAAPRYVRAQAADLVLCDRIAADPGDPDKPKDVKGVAAIAPSDIVIAIKFCKVAAARSRRALYQLGRAYAANGQKQQAAAAYRKAADKGSSAAMVKLGELMAGGAGAAKDEAQARKLLERAAEAGNARAVTDLASLSGSGTATMDPVKARALLAKAAEANSAEAQYQLGLMTAAGVGGPRDDAAARALFEKAAAQNHAGALEQLGVFAQDGRGGPRDTSAAKAYYKKAAALGDADAKAALKRLECPYVIKDKRGKFVTSLCF